MHHPHGVGLCPTTSSADVDGRLLEILSTIPRPHNQIWVLAGHIQDFLAELLFRWALKPEIYCDFAYHNPYMIYDLHDCAINVES